MGFTVEIAGHGFLPVKSVSGGALVAGTKQSVSELEIVAFVTPNQKHLAEIARKAHRDGLDYRVNITITEAVAGKPTVTRNFKGCLLRQLSFPSFEAGSGELMTETATFKPTSVG